MAFSFGGILAGVSEKIVERIEDEEERLEEIAREERSIATRQRLARESERRKKQAVLDESAGMMAMLGYDKDTIESILAKGSAASQFAVTAGQTAMAKGVDPNTIWNFHTDAKGNTAQDKVSEAIEIAAPTKVGDITATSKAAPELPSPSTSDSVVNLEVYQNLFAEPKPVEKSFDSALAVISQKLSRTDDPKKIAELEREQTKLLEDLARKKEAEREQEGENTPTFTATTINSFESTIRRGELKRYGFQLDIDGEIKNMTDGNRHLFDVANLSVAKQMATRNKDINDPLMNLAIQGIRDSALDGLSNYGYDKVNAATPPDNYYMETPEVARQKIQARNYKIGDVVNVNGELFVYTGVLDYQTGQPLIKIGEVGG